MLSRQPRRRRLDTAENEKRMFTVDEAYTRSGRV